MAVLIERARLNLRFEVLPRITRGDSVAAPLAVQRSRPGEPCSWWTDRASWGTGWLAGVRLRLTRVVQAHAAVAQRKGSVSGRAR
jgi:hypothetical protein